jgi:iron complex transport system permease protein
MVAAMTGQSRTHIGRQLTLILALLLPVCLLLAIARGTVNIAPAETLTALIDTLRGQAVGQAAVIIGEIRLPRVLLAALVGAILASSGAAMQGLFRNPLADPSLIGVTAGASLGASIAIVGAGGAMAGLAGITLVSVGAFIGGLLAVILVYRLATSASGTSVATMLLAGIAISALAGAIGNVLEFYSSNETLRRISLWQMGGLDGANYERVAVAGLVAALVLICLPRFATALDALLLGESEARHLGIDVDRTTRFLVVIVAIGVGASVALGGTIAFVGLVVPHIIRMLAGPSHGPLLRNSALAGAVLLVLADLLARVILAPTELPVGIVTAMIGVPFFVLLLRQRGQYGMS